MGPNIVALATQCIAKPQKQSVMIYLSGLYDLRGKIAMLVYEYVLFQNKEIKTRLQIQQVKLQLLYIFQVDTLKLLSEY